MPIYEYKCENGRIFDVMQRMSETHDQSASSAALPSGRCSHPVWHLPSGALLDRLQQQI